VASLASPQSEEHTPLIEEFRALARDVLRPIARSGEPGRVNRPLVRALGEHGLLGRLFKGYESGQADVSALELCMIREALATESTDAETAFALQGLGAHPIVAGGRKAVVERWVPLVAQGEAVAAFALTEPGAGSDAGALELAAAPVDGGYRLDGVKTFISNAPDADVYTIFARTTPGAGSRGVTAFAVPGDAEGLAGTPLSFVSDHPIGRIELDGVFVPEAQVLGKIDEGFRLAMGTLDLFRPSVGAFSVGMAQAALDASIVYADERHAFGRALREHQAVSHMLAEMAARLYAARLLVHAAAAEYDGHGPQIRLKAAIAKLSATETAQFVVDSAIQIHGAVALERGHLLEHLYRDVRAPRIYEGTSGIQREIIVRELYRSIRSEPAST
jgi:acyl-CoA dehydrogenase